MYNISVIYDYSYDGMWPAWMVLKPRCGCFDWSTETIYVPIEAPFQRLSRDEMNDDSLGISIIQTDLVMSVKKPNHFGIYLPRVKLRLNKLRGEKLTPFFRMSDIEHLIIQMCDIEIVMGMNISTRFAWDYSKNDRSQFNGTDF